MWIGVVIALSHRLRAKGCPGPPVRVLSSTVMAPRCRAARWRSSVAMDVAHRGSATPTPMPPSVSWAAACRHWGAIAP
ncbi:hypothetical protein AN217_16250 [Streptomyces qinglanensis]|uniref:Uncharacterized protein n=1 Tax=Streptomyces qinglanensis TaxID=943816 RepID=A0A1E7K5J6_9ACTN|nr:hypothetical protein AN217_16250 [Streptomyces qinglanensis]